ncbi:MAG: hypothetical protein ACJ76P_04125 [Actinomycetota bacterium]
MILRVSPRIAVREEDLRALLQEGFRGVGKDDVEVQVVANRSRWIFSGKAWPELPARRATSARTRYLVEISMPRKPSGDGFPYRWKYPRLKTAPRLEAWNWQERLVALAAHEAYHVRQFRLGMRKSEVAAERWAGRSLERFRAAQRGREISTTTGRWSEARAMSSSNGTRTERISRSRVRKT